MPTLHLVVDELVPVDKFQFRVRMWRQAGFPPIVLSSQVRGHPPPDWYSSLLGNLVLRSFLGYALPIPVFFELSVLSEKTRAFRVRYETIGCDLRPILHKPKLHALETPGRRAALRSHARHSQLKGAPCWLVSHRSSSRAFTLRPRRRSLASSGT